MLPVLAYVIVHQTRSEWASDTDAFLPLLGSCDALCGRGSPARSCWGMARPHAVSGHWILWRPSARMSRVRIALVHLEDHTDRGLRAQPSARGLSGVAGAQKAEGEDEVQYGASDVAFALDVGLEVRQCRAAGYWTQLALAFLGRDRSRTPRRSRRSGPPCRANRARSRQYCRGARGGGWG